MVYGVSTTAPFESKKFNASQFAHWNSVVPLEYLDRLPQKWQLKRQNISRCVLSHLYAGFRAMAACLVGVKRGIGGVLLQFRLKLRSVIVLVCVHCFFATMKEGKSD